MSLRFLQGTDPQLVLDVLFVFLLSSGVGYSEAVLFLPTCELYCILNFMWLIMSFFWFVPTCLCFMYVMAKLGESQHKSPRSQLRVIVARVIFLC